MKVSGLASSSEGVNRPGFIWLSAGEQARELTMMRSSGISRVRFDLAPPFDRAISAIKSAADHGVHVLLVINPNYQPFYPSDKGRPIHRLADFRLSRLNVPNAVNILAEVLKQLDALRVPLLGIEVGNELNLAGFNADLGTGRGLCQVSVSRLPPEEQHDFKQGLDRYREFALALFSKTRLTKYNAKVRLISAGLAVEGECPTETEQHSVAPGEVFAALEDLFSGGVFSAVGVHYYFSGPELASPINVPSVFPLCESFNQPCWLTEWGVDFNAGDSSESKRVNRSIAQSAHALITKAKNKGSISGSFFHAWNGGEPQHNIFIDGVPSEERSYVLHP